MNQAKVKATYKLILKYLEEEKYIFLFSKLRLLVAQLQQWWAIERCDELELTCKNMIRYSIMGKDDSFDEIKSKLDIGLYEFVSAVYDSIVLTQSDGYLANQSRRLNDSIELSIDIIAKGSINNQGVKSAYCHLFKAIWLIPANIDNEKRNRLLSLFGLDISPTIKAGLLSAIYLRLIRLYDDKLMNFLQVLLESDDIIIRNRAKVIYVLVFAKYCKNAIANKSRHLKVVQAILSQNKIFSTTAGTFLTQTVADKIVKDIYSTLSNSSIKMKDLLIEEDDSLFNENENEELKSLLNDEQMMDKLYKINDLQFAGVDIYYSSFSGLKGYSFFKEIANWFVPFDLNYLEYKNDDLLSNSVVSAIVSQNNICDSDKYSILLTLNEMPAAAISSAAEQFSISKEDLEQDNIGENWKGKSSATEDLIIRNYIFDLYRFYNLFSHNSSFENPFADVVKMSAYIEQKEWKNGFISLYKSGKYDLCVQMQQRQESLKMIAKAYTKLERYDEAIEIYNKILNELADDWVVLLELAQLYYKKKDYQKAVSLYASADLLGEDNDIIISGLAKSQFMVGDLAKAMANFSKLRERGSCKGEDLLYLGHCYSVLAEKELAIDLYLRYVGSLDDEEQFMERYVADYEIIKEFVSYSDFLLMANQVIMLYNDVKNDNFTI